MSLSTSTSPLSEDWSMTPPHSEPPMSIPPSSTVDLSSVAAITPEKSSTCPVNTPPIRHSKYYIDEQMAIFLVDNHLYKVHRHFLRRESLKFAYMLDHLPPDQCGQADENPIVLPNVTQGEFEALLSYFYTGLFFKAAENSLCSLQEYIDLLSIATRYGCIDVRKKAIDDIESLRPDAVQRVVLAEKFDIPSWLEAAYIELCKREKPLEMPEGEQLGLQKVILIACAREKLRESDREPSPSTAVHPPNSIFGSGRPSPQTSTSTLDSRASRIVNEIFFSVTPSSKLVATPQPSTSPVIATFSFGANSKIFSNEKETEESLKEAESLKKAENLKKAEDRPATLLGSNLKKGNKFGRK